MGAEDQTNSLDVDAIVRQFPRLRRGYDPDAVDQHLAQLASQMKVFIDRQHNAPDESLELVLKATRRSVDEALQDARGRADAIVAEAHTRAAEVEADAQARCRALDAEGRERYLEMGRLADARTDALAELDRLVALHREALRVTAADLEDLAADLGDLSSPRPRSIAALDDGDAEIVLDAQPAKDR